MIQGRNRQAGFTMWGWMLVLSIAGFFLTLAANIGPVYLRNYTVQSTIKSLQGDKELADKSEFDIRNAIEKRFNVNQIEAIQAICRNKAKPCMKITKTKDMLTIDANYEERKHVMANVDVVVMFQNNVVEIPIAGGR